MPEQTTPAADWTWQDDPDVISWDWHQGPDLPELTALLGRHGLTVTEVDTGTDDVAIRVGSATVEVMQDWLLARTWAAALRWLSGQIARQADASDWVAELAAQIESGNLTPWADDTEPELCQVDDDRPDAWGTCLRELPCPKHPEPTTAPAEAAATAPVDPDPHPDTPPHASGILGRALLVRGELWPEAQEGRWRLPAGESTYDTEWIRANVGPVRELLLVDPAAAHVIEAAQQWRSAAGGGDVPALWADKADLALMAAVDALTGGQPLTWTEAGAQAQADTERAEARRTTLAEREADTPLDAAAITEALKAGNIACVQYADRDLQAFAELPDCEACDGCGKQVPPDWRGGPQPAVEPCGATDGNGLVCDREVGHPPPCDQIQRTGPEPAGDGPGWDREVVQLVISSMHDGPVERARADQLRALLADRDQMERDLKHARADRQDLWDTRDKRNHRWMEAAERYQTERDTARAELADVRGRLVSIQRQHDSATNALAEVTAERDRYRALLAERGELEQIGDQLRDQIRRDTAAATLDWVAEQSVCAAVDTDAHGTAEERISLRQWATEMRNGLRDTPGSPEPYPIIGYQAGGQLYDPADVVIVRSTETDGDQHG